MNLFRNDQEWTLHSGDTADWKIDCDALTDEDWDTLGQIASELLPVYDLECVVGIATGGIKFANGVASWGAIDYSVSPWIICDDVLTTGASDRPTTLIPFGRWSVRPLPCTGRERPACLSTSRFK